MARLSRDVLITEKLDGTNASVLLVPRPPIGTEVTGYTAATGDYLIWAGSRNRWITPQNDNYGFAAWVRDNAEELAKLGAGRHFGEWWGSGVQRGYGLSKGEKRFSLFNAARWVECFGGEPSHALSPISQPDDRLEPKMQEYAPHCCHVVPVLYKDVFSTGTIERVLEGLRVHGSVAAPGFMDPEGVIVFHTAANVGFKKTIKDDATPKGGAR